MPQPSFEIPFTTLPPPDLRDARARHLRWLQETGLIREDDARRRYVAAGFIELVGAIFPTVDGEDLDLLLDAVSWFFAIDDALDQPPGPRLEQALDVCRTVLALLASPPAPAPAEAHPLVVAFADWWERETQGMSPWWVRLAAHNWAEFLYGNFTEAAHRITGTLPETEAYLTMRRRTIGVPPTLDLAERAYRLEVPIIAWHDSRFQHLIRLTTEHNILVNDTYSLDKDEANGTDNLVLCLMRDQGCSRATAFNSIEEKANTHIRTFVRLAEQVPQFAQQLGLTPQEHMAVDRNIDTMRYLMRVQHDWGFSSTRYQPPEMPPPGPAPTHAQSPTCNGSPYRGGIPFPPRAPGAIPEGG